jgi:dTDP-4-amino-4,6-dideoxygalactose transaminase
VVRTEPAARRSVIEGLRARGIEPNVHYIPVHLQPYYRKLGFKRGDYPAAESFYEGAVSLPLFPALSDAEQQRVCEALRALLQC